MDIIKNHLYRYNNVGRMLCQRCDIPTQSIYIMKIPKYTDSVCVCYACARLLRPDLFLKEL